MNLNFKNKGMYIEELINNTSSFYTENNTMYIEKRFLPIQPLSINENKVIGKLLRKSTVDYVCMYKGYYIDFEVKQTNDDSFELSKIKPHQINHIKRINKMGGFTFILVYFFKKDAIICIDYDQYRDLINKKIKKIFWDDQYEKLEIIFPGIINFESFLKNKLKNKK